jgi:hypothetical protein
MFKRKDFRETEPFDGGGYAGVGCGAPHEGGTGDHLRVSGHRHAQIGRIACQAEQLLEGGAARMVFDLLGVLEHQVSVPFELNLALHLRYEA